MITWPTIVTQSTATLIDNMFVSEKLHKYFESAVILDDRSLAFIGLVETNKFIR